MLDLEQRGQRENKDCQECREFLEHLAWMVSLARKVGEEWPA